MSLQKRAAVWVWMQAMAIACPDLQKAGNRLDGAQKYAWIL